MTAKIIPSADMQTRMSRCTHLRFSARRICVRRCVHVAVGRREERGGGGGGGVKVGLTGRGCEVGEGGRDGDALITVPD